MKYSAGKKKKKRTKKWSRWCYINCSWVGSLLIIAELIVSLSVSLSCWKLSLKTTTTKKTLLSYYQPKKLCLCSCGCMCVSRIFLEWRERKMNCLRGNVNKARLWWWVYFLIVCATFKIQKSAHKYKKRKNSAFFLKAVSILLTVAYNTMLTEIG